MPEIKETSKVGEKGQTTVPVKVREVLGLKGGDLILWRVRGKTVTVEKIPLE